MYTHSIYKQNCMNVVWTCMFVCYVFHLEGAQIPRIYNQSIIALSQRLFTFVDAPPIRAPLRLDKQRGPCKKEDRFAFDFPKIKSPPWSFIVNNAVILEQQVYNLCARESNVHSSEQVDFRNNKKKKYSPTSIRL